ncbi:MAG: SLOG family protein [Negativibacillus sp.]
MTAEEKITCCFTGHRVLSREELLHINPSLREVVRQRIEEGYSCFAAGGARGFDTAAALTVLEMKRIYPHIRLRLILPCKNQSKGWNQREKETYQRILTQADQVDYIWEEYLPGCFQARNRALVEASSCCICYLRSGSGGTEFTVNRAKEKGIPVYNLAL